ncbi:unnamed protein product [Cochlearia groenlandica]
MALDLDCSDVETWKKALFSYESRIEAMNKPDLVSLDQFYRVKLPSLIREREPSPYITTSELSDLMKWKLSRGKWRPRLLGFVSALKDSLVKTASEKAFKALPDVSMAVKELVVLKGVGPATASAVLAAYAPDVVPFMSEEAMEVALGSSKEYSLKRYLLFVTKLQEKSKELKLKGEWDGPSDIERALWSCNKRSKSKAEKISSEKSQPEKISSEKSQVEKSSSEKSQEKKSSSEKSQEKKSSSKKSKPEKSSLEKSQAEKISSEKISSEKSQPEKSSSGKSQEKKSSSKKSNPENISLEKSKPEKSSLEKLKPEKSSSEKLETKKRSLEKSETKKSSSEKKRKRVGVTKV